MVGWEGFYEVSSLGRARSLDRVVVNKHGQGQPYKGKVLSFRESAGYNAVNLGAKQQAKIHWLVAAAFIGPRPDGAVIRHLDGDRKNNTPENLTYGSHSENRYDAVDHGSHFPDYKTHCKNGHEFTEENTFWEQPRPGRSRRYRQCRACMRERSRAAKDRQRGVVNDK